MVGEMNTFIKVWLSIFTSLSYCYAIGKIVPKGVRRLFFVLPILCLFLSLPLKLSSINFSGGTAFCITWLANFKLLLFAFGKGPLALDPPISLGRFIVVSCLPIEIRENPPKKHLKHQKETKPISLLLKALLLGILVRAYDYKEHMPQKVMSVFLCLLIYLLLEIILAIVAALARAMLGLELEPHFNEPYLSTSLQDFWGRRWNLMVTRILRPTVYNPTLILWARLVGHRWAQILAVMATFVVSGLVHELIYYYLGRVRPTWEVTWFFVLHGSCLTVEIALKKAYATTWRLPRVVSGALTIGFMLLTSFWLFFPQLLRCEADVRLLQEYAALGGFLKSFITQR
ncbi:acyl-CoA--sterol O-acyltransferase 1-like [Morus notabilis]|uniref:acyl-CoA--sterol O-acyltransferase 1-like n=1 Tax=Morus notabilis TaxID=981085 RepID=UPI000CED228E|nr:acyl-CoA--sterol O-acyltransferase 1-like [Morus notabilis]